MSGDGAGELLRGLAAAYGIQTEYRDWQHRDASVTEESLRAILAAFGVDTSSAAALRDALAARQADLGRPLPPCVVLRAGERFALPTGTTALTIDLEDGSTRRARTRFPHDLPPGYHRLRARVDGGWRQADLVVTPVRAGVPHDVHPSWGLAVQLYSVLSSRSWGVGDLGDLASLAEWVAREHDADFVLVNPLHAAEIVAPMTPSPYLPTSRRFGNPLYLRVEDVSGYDRLSDDDRARISTLRAEAQPLGEFIDRDRTWAAKRAALEIVFAAGLDDAQQDALERYRADGGAELERFATWCALCERHGNDWRRWPVALRDPHAPDVVAGAPPERITLYCWLQSLVDAQLATAQRRALDAGMRFGIVHDVAVGVSPSGADAWSWQNVMADGVTVGAPPDAYSQTGQDWQQPPWRPDRLAAHTYAPLRDMFRAALRRGGGLRVDHIIGMFRLWWIPDGADARAGTYVRYDPDALIGILALEAQRAGAVVIGEDLGNVDPRTRQYLHERGLLGTSILWFEVNYATGEPLAPSQWRADCLASVTTHDLPPTAGYLDGEHIRMRERLGLLVRPVGEEYADARKERAAWVSTLRGLDLLGADVEPTDDDVVVALHAFLARTPARLRCVALTDLVGERRAQNQPGTDDDQHPNWRIPLGDVDGAPVLLDDIVTARGDSPLATRTDAIIAAVRA